MYVDTKDTTTIWTGHTISVYLQPVPYGWISPGYCADLADDAGNHIITVGPYPTDRAAFNAAIDHAQIS